MKNCVSIIITYLLLAGVSCKKSENLVPKDETTVSITVKGRSGIARPGVTVYQMRESIHHMYGTDTNYAEHKRLTASNGIAVFYIDSIALSIGEKRTYFFIKYSDSTGTHASIYWDTLRKGDRKAGNLLMQ